MNSDYLVKVIETKRKPPIWSVKAGARYVTSFIGNDARKRAISYAAKNFAEFEIVEKPVPKREQTVAPWSIGESRPVETA
jgi:hypothetical protein